MNLKQPKKEDHNFGAKTKKNKLSFVKIKLNEKEILDNQPQEDIDLNWILDNTDMGDMVTINEIIGHFLGVSAQGTK